MGTYLSTPASEKYKEWGENLDCPVRPLRFCVVDMQGWRKSMEDAHVVETTVPYPPGLPYLTSKKAEDIPKAKVFGVFDGHGGPEVARFCQLYLVSVLTKQELWKPDSELGDEAQLPTHKLPEKEDAPENSAIGQALIASFHALDRMIDDPSRRDEIIRLRTQKAPPTERRDAGVVPPVKIFTPSDGSAGLKVSELAEGVTASNVLPPPLLSPSPPSPPHAVGAGNVNEDIQTVDETGAGRRDHVEGVKQLEHDSSMERTEQNDKTQEENSVTDDLISNAPAQATTSATTNRDDKQSARDKGADGEGAECEVEEDYDSDEAVGNDEAARDHSLLEDDDDSHDDVQINPYDGAIQMAESRSSEHSVTDPAVPSNKVTVMFQRLLNLNEKQSGQMVIRVAGEAGGSNHGELSQAPARVGPSAASPSILQNGRLICNLPDHPVHAGCTAIVAVLLGMTLTIANAGDSRGVLCREGGKTEPLSFDHKPQQPREMNRINSAGGFVNRFGRVNGNLNLSRSIGDLKYKQVPGIAPADQMITAQPDIVQITLKPKDEFLILGCDGIWDCLTNEKAVEFVRERIDTKEPTEIGEEMLNAILSDDPRATQGIGGDNMTVLIVDLQPGSRSYTVNPSWGPEVTTAL